jgi:hypothetical protein
MHGPAPFLDQRPARVQRTVSCRGCTEIIDQCVQAGLRYAGQMVTIKVDETTLCVYDQHDQSIKTFRAPAARRPASRER